MGIFAKSEQWVKLPSLLLWRKKYNMEFIIWCLPGFLVPQELEVFELIETPEYESKYKYLGIFLCSLGFNFGRPKWCFLGKHDARAWLVLNLTGYNVRIYLF